VDFLADNVVWILSVAWLIVVAAAVLYAVLAALRLWRTLKATKARIEPVSAQLSMSADVARQGVAALEARQRDLEEASGDLSRQANAAAVAGRHAGEVAAALRYPVRFLAGL
jgi:hypothetical protein